MAERKLIPSVAGRRIQEASNCFRNAGRFRDGPVWTATGETRTGWVAAYVIEGVLSVKHAEWRQAAEAMACAAGGMDPYLYKEPRDVFDDIATVEACMAEVRPSDFEHLDAPLSFCMTLGKTEYEEAARLMIQRLADEGAGWDEPRIATYDGSHTPSVYWGGMVAAGWAEWHGGRVTLTPPAIAVLGDRVLRRRALAAAAEAE